MTKKTQLDQTKTFYLNGDEAGKLLAKQLCMEHSLPNGNYDIEMQTTAFPHKINIKITLKYNGEVKV